MKIETSFSIPLISKARRRSKTSSVGSGFAEVLDEVSLVDAPTEIAHTAPVNALDAILALQEVSDEEGQRKRAIKSGHSALDELEKLRVAMLFGAVPKERLLAIKQQMVNLKTRTHDPELHIILEEIEIRAAVELAKYGF